MLQVKPTFATFADYLAYSDALEGQYLLINGELVESPPESRFMRSRLYTQAIPIRYQRHRRVPDR
jgi:hypothetical protein